MTLGDFHLPRAEPITGSPRIAAAAGLRHIARPKRAVGHVEGQLHYRSVSQSSVRTAEAGEGINH